MSIKTTNQFTLFPEPPDPRPPITITWNPIHGCTKLSSGCLNCYMFRRDESVGKDPTKIRKTQSFKLPVRKLRAGEYKGFFKIPSSSHIYTCFSSDFFHSEADEWRADMWDMIRQRSDCTFFMITKRPERIKDTLPPDWGNGWEHVTIAVTCENQKTADTRLPVYLSLPLCHYAVMIEPMLSRVNLRPYLTSFCSNNGKSLIQKVSVGGESGPKARICEYAWVLDVHMQCVEYNVPFYYHQTGARLRRGGKIYNIAREHQHTQAQKAGLDFDGIRMPAWDESI